MIPVHPTLLMLLVEALGVLLLVQIVWSVMAWLRKRRERAAAGKLIAAVTADAEARAARNGEAIGPALSLTDDALAERVKQAENAQKLLLQTVLLGWTRRDADAVARLHEPLEALVGCWRSMLADTGVDGDARAAGDEALAARLEAVEEEKETIAEELRITRETVNRMLNEYAAMYQRGDTKDDSTARRLLSGQRVDSPHGDDTDLPVLDQPVSDAPVDLDDARLDPDLEMAADEPAASGAATGGGLTDGLADDDADLESVADGDDVAEPEPEASEEAVPEDVAAVLRDVEPDQVAMPADERAVDAGEEAPHGDGDASTGTDELAGLADDGAAEQEPMDGAPEDEDADEVQRLQEELESLFDQPEDGVDLGRELADALGEDPFNGMDLDDAAAEEESGQASVGRKAPAAETAAAQD